MGTDDAIAKEIQQIITDIKGEVGGRKQKNLERVRRAAFEALDVGGPSFMAMKELVAYGTPKHSPN